MNTVKEYSLKAVKLTPEMAHEILKKYHSNYEGFNELSERSSSLSEYANLKFFNFNCWEINNLVYYWRETQDQIVFDSMFESYMIIYKKMLPRFLAVSNTIKKDVYSYDLDLFQDFIFIFHKCLNDYKCVDVPSFKSYAMNHMQFFLGEQIRTRYFSLLVIPQATVKKQRKKIKILLKDSNDISEDDLEFIKEHKNENYIFVKNELDESIATIEIENDVIDNMFDQNIIDILNKLIEKDIIKSWHLDAFIKKYGIFGREYKQTEIAKIYKVSDSTISKVIKGVRETLFKNEYLQKAYFGDNYKNKIRKEN